jgi:hypothetical protein
MQEISIMRAIFVFAFTIAMAPYFAFAATDFLSYAKGPLTVFNQCTKDSATSATGTSTKDKLDYVVIVLENGDFAVQCYDTPKGEAPWASWCFYKNGKTTCEDFVASAAEGKKIFEAIDEAKKHPRPASETAGSIAPVVVVTQPINITNITNNSSTTNITNNINKTTTTNAPVTNNTSNNYGGGGYGGQQAGYSSGSGSGKTVQNLIMGIALGVGIGSLVNSISKPSSYWGTPSYGGGFGGGYGGYGGGSSQAIWQMGYGGSSGGSYGSTAGGGFFSGGGTSAGASGNCYSPATGWGGNSGGDGGATPIFGASTAGCGSSGSWFGSGSTGGSGGYKPGTFSPGNSDAPNITFGSGNSTGGNAKPWVNPDRVSTGCVNGFEPECRGGSGLQLYDSPTVGDMQPGGLGSTGIGNWQTSVTGANNGWTADELAAGHASFDATDGSTFNSVPSSWDTVYTSQAGGSALGNWDTMGSNAGPVDTGGGGGWFGIFGSGSSFFGDSDI